MFTIGLIGGLIAAALWFARSCQFRVDEGQLAVVTSFGAAKRKPNRALITYGPGLHFKRPWERVQRVSMREQSLELSGENGQRVMAEDGTVLRLEASLRYTPEEAGLEQFLFGLKRHDAHINGLFTCLLRCEIANMAKPATTEVMSPMAEMAEAAGSYGLIRRERQLLNERLANASRKQLGSVYGVKFLAVDLIDILPPDELADALNAVMNARSEADSQRFKAESESRQQLLSAEQGVEIARTHAAAVQIEMNTLAKHLGTLDCDDVLSLYVARRRTELLAQSRTLYVNEGASR